METFYYLQVNGATGTLYRTLDALGAAMTRYAAVVNKSQLHLTVSHVHVEGTTPAFNEDEIF